MFGHYRTLLRTARVTLAAMLLSVLALTPFGLHAHPAQAQPNFHADFCGAALDKGAGKTLPASPHKVPAASTCNDCAGCAGGLVVRVPSAAPWIAMATATVDAIIPASPATAPIGGVVSRPRGPPVSA